MSYFTVLVIGDNPEDQLKLFDRSVSSTRTVSDVDLSSFVESYIIHDPDERTYIKISRERLNENKKLSIFELYEKHGYDWNGDSWKFDKVKNIWEEESLNYCGKFNEYLLGGRYCGFFKLKSWVNRNQGAIGKSIYNNESIYDVAQAIKKDIDFEFMKKDKPLLTFAVIKNGEWHERENVDPLRRDSVKFNEWSKEFWKLVNESDDSDLFSLYDCHI